MKSVQLALAWLLDKPEVASPVVGPTNVEQLEEFAAAVDIKLTADDKRRLEAPYNPHSVIGHKRPPLALKAHDRAPWTHFVSLNSR